MRLSICIVTWNCAADLRACLEALAADDFSGELEVVVVDNASADDSVAVARSHPLVRHVVRNQVNRGFSAGNNTAIQLTTGRYVMLLNPDTAVHRGALAQLVEYLETHPSVGAVGPRLLNSDGTLQPSCRRFPSLGAGFFRNTPLGRLFPKNRYVQEYLMTDWDHTSPRAVDWVSGAAVVVRRQVLREVGLLDERFTMYCEDVDWCYRMHQQGWEVHYLPSAVIVHHVGRSSDKRMVGSLIHFHQSMYRFYIKHYRDRYARWLQPAIAVGIMLRLFGALSRVWWHGFCARISRARLSEQQQAEHREAMRGRKPRL